jgi:hypothetical protein
MFKDFELLLHPTFGVIGMLAAVWVFVEALNASEDNAARMRTAAKWSTAMIWLSCITAGYFYILYYGADKAIIKEGPWPWAHNLMMETKEHLFFLTLIMATLLSIVTARPIFNNRAARNVVLTTSAGVVVLVLAMEGAGAFISTGAKLGLAMKLGM